MVDFNRKLMELRAHKAKEKETTEAEEVTKTEVKREPPTNCLDWIEGYLAEPRALNTAEATELSWYLKAVRLFLGQLPGMSKRIWVPDENGGFQEIADGAVPMWWIVQELGRLGIKADGKKEG